MSFLKRCILHTFYSLRVTADKPTSLKRRGDAESAGGGGVDVQGR